jgi:hypothetical protein
MYHILSQAFEVKPPLSIIPYFDRVCFWLKNPIDAATDKRLRATCAEAYIGKPRRARFDPRYRQWIDIKRPTDEALQWLAARRDAKLTYVEPALDYSTGSPDDQHDLYELLDWCQVRNWHGRRQQIRGHLEK